MGLTSRAAVPWRRFATILLLTAVGVFFLGVDTLPIVTNDSLRYLDHSRALTEAGWVEDGYRQIGYPATLALDRWLASVAGVEPLLFTVVIQRALLAGALAYAIWLWRWYSLPVVVLVLTPEFLVLPNFVLTEGLAVPLSLLLAVLASHYYRALDQDDLSGEVPRKAFWLAVAVSVLAMVLLAVRFPLAVYGWLPLLCAAMAYRRYGSRSRPVIVVLAFFLVAAVGFSFAASAENNDDFDVFFPTTNGGGAEYWGAWRLTFGLHPENQDRPELQEYWDEGSPHPLIARIGAAYPSYSDQARALEEATVDLLETSGTTRSRERIFSILGSLRGGRHNDLENYTNTALRSGIRDLDEIIYRNTFAIENGPEAFAERYNDGRLPEVLWTSSVFPRLPVPALQSLLRLGFPAALLGTIILAIVKRRLALGLVYLVPTLVLAAGMGWLLLDNLRLLISTITFGVAGLCALWAVGTTRPGLSPPTSAQGSALSTRHDSVRAS